MAQHIRSLAHQLKLGTFLKVTVGHTGTFKIANYDIFFSRMLDHNIVGIRQGIE